jgi:hypothetical protein
VADYSPPGLEFHRAEAIALADAKPQVREVTLSCPVNGLDHNLLLQAIAEFRGQPTHVVVREPNKKRVDIRPHVSELSLRDDVLEMRLTVTPEMAVRPREVLSALGIPDVESQGVCLTRTKVELRL